MTAPSLRALGTVVAATTTSPSFAAPAGAIATDVILVAYFQGDGRTTSTAPAGFTLAADLRQVNNPAAGDPSHSLYVWWGRFSDVGAGPYTFTVTVGSGGTPFIEGRTAAIQGCATSGNPFEAADGNTSGASAVTTAPAVSATSTGTDRYAFYVATNWSGGAWTPASGFTEQWDANDRIITIDDLTMPTAATTSPQAVCAGSNDSNAWVGILLPVTSAAVTPSPYVVTAPAQPAAGRQLLVRNAAALIVPPTTGVPPYVVTAPAPSTSAAALTRRSTLVDPPVLTTVSPTVITGQPTTQRGAALLLRSSLVDPAAPSAATGSPQVVTGRPAPTAPTAVVLMRTAPPDPATPGPYVVTGPAAAAAATARPMLLRATLADPPVLTTPAPTVVTAPTIPAPGTAALLRAPAAAAPPASGPTTAPLVVTHRRSPDRARVVLLRCGAGLVSSTAPGPVVHTTTRAATVVTTRPRAQVTTVRERLLRTNTRGD